MFEGVIDMNWNAPGKDDTKGCLQFVGALCTAIVIGGLVIGGLFWIAGNAITDQGRDTARDARLETIERKYENVEDCYTDAVVRIASLEGQLEILTERLDKLTKKPIGDAPPQP